MNISIGFVTILLFQMFSLFDCISCVVGRLLKSLFVSRPTDTSHKTLISSSFLLRFLLTLLPKVCSLSLV